MIIKHGCSKRGRERERKRETKRERMRERGKERENEKEREREIMRERGKDIPSKTFSESFSEGKKSILLSNVFIFYIIFQPEGDFFFFSIPDDFFKPRWRRRPNDRPSYDIKKNDQKSLQSAKKYFARFLKNESTGS